MSNEFKHKALPWDTKVNRKRWQAEDAHQADGETADDILYFNGTYWKRTTFSNFLESSPTNGETGKAPDSNWAFDHDADASAHHIKYTNAEAAAQVTYENMDTSGDVGTGAGQLAIGNHTHTLADDVAEGAGATGLDLLASDTTPRGVKGSISAGGEWEAVSITQTYATVSRASAFAVAFVKALTAEALKMRLYMGGVQMAEYGWISTSVGWAEAESMKALAGSQICKIGIHNYAGDAVYLEGFSDDAAKQPPIYLTVGSIKI